MFFAKKKNDFYKISTHSQTLTYSFYISVIIKMSFDFWYVNVRVFPNVDVMFYCKGCVIMFNNVSVSTNLNTS